MMMTTPSNINHSRSYFFLQLLMPTHGVFKRLLFLFLLLWQATAQTGTLSSSSSSPSPPSDQVAFGPRFNPKIAVIMVILVGAFFFMGFFSVYVRQCTERRFIRANMDPAAAAAMGERGLWSMRAPVGLDAAVIETFPTFLYSAVKGLKIGKDALECAVCLNEFEDDETLRLIPNCSHVFHPDCIDAWLFSHTTCPVCRANLVSKPGELIFGSVHIFEPDSNPVEPTPPSTTIDVETQNEAQINVVDNVGRSREVSQVQFLDDNLLYPANENRPWRSRSSGWQFNILFPRSHSTGHSMVQPEENHERFTLRLPEDVRSRLLNTRLSRAKSCVAFPRVRSSRRGYRSGSQGSGRDGNYFDYEWFDQEGRSDRSGLTISSSRVVGSNQEVNSSPPPKDLFKSAKLSFDGAQNANVIGQSSFERLNPDNQAQIHYWHGQFD